MAHGHKKMRKYLQDWGLKVLHEGGKVVLKETFSSLWGKEPGAISFHGDGRLRTYQERKTFAGEYPSLREAFLQHRDHYVRNILTETYPEV